MGQCARVGVGLAGMLTLTPACFSDPPAASDPAGTEAGGSTAALTTSSSTDTTGTSAVTGTTVPDPTESSSGEEPGDSSSSSSGFGSGVGSSSSSDDTANTTSDSPPDFFDDFDRANSPMLGNGWEEKLPAAWEILGGDVAAQSTPTGNSYYDFLVYRAEEEVRDLTIQMEFSIGTEDADNEPHLILRVQPSSLAVGSQYHAYILVPRPSLGQLCIMRFAGGGVTPVCQDLSTAGLPLGGPYRLTFSADGDQPVLLDGILEVADRDGGWTMVSTVSWSDNDPTDHISEAGFYGFSGGTGPNVLANYRLDNFLATFDR